MPRIQWSDIVAAARQTSEELVGKEWVTAGIKARTLLADLADEVERLRLAERERDALAAVVDRHVASVVAEKYYSDPAWVIVYRAEVEAYHSRAEAEEAYRRMTGLGLDARTEAPDHA